MCDRYDCWSIDSDSMIPAQVQFNILANSFLHLIKFLRRNQDDNIHKSPAEQGEINKCRVRDNAKTQFHAQLGHQDKGCAINGLVVYNDWDLKPLINMDILTFKVIINNYKFALLIILCKIVFKMDILTFW